MRIKKLSIMMLIALSLAAFLNGCGSSSKEGTASITDLNSVPKVSESNCAQCHGSSFDSKTGEQIYVAYNASQHFASGVGCQDCHGGGSQHNGVGPIPFPSPAEAKRCQNCHTKAAFKNAAAPHFLDYSASYISPNAAATPTCNFCHKGHNPDMATYPSTIVADWKGNHGNVNVLPFNEDFMAKGPQPGITSDANTIGTGTGSECNRCHSTSGFMKYVNSTYTDPSWVIDPATPTLRPNSALKKIAGANEVIACGACHSFPGKGAVRSIPAVLGHYNDIGKSAATASIQYGDASGSNVCVACHEGRTAGITIKSLALKDYSASKAPVRYPHDGPAALIFLGAAKGGGYEFYSSVRYKNLSYFAHDKIGTTVAGTPLPLYPTTGINGPCAGCHMTPVKPAVVASHTFSVFNALSNVDAGNTDGVCSTCHKVGQHGFAAGSFTTAKAEFASARKALMILAGQVLGIDPSDRQSSKIKYAGKGLKSSNPLNGRNNMGAGFNAAVLYFDAGSYAHNNNYSKLLIFDSINWLKAPDMTAINDRAVTGAGGTNVKAAICGIADAATVKKNLTSPAFIAGESQWTSAVDQTPALKFLGFTTDCAGVAIP